MIKKFDSFKRDFGTISYKELASKIDGVSESKIKDFINDSTDYKKRRTINFKN